MENSNNIILTMVGLIILAAQTILFFRRAPFQNSLEDASASEKYQTVVKNMQVELAEARAEIKEMQAMMRGSTLSMHMHVEMLGAPVIKSWSWVPKEETENEKG